MEWEEKRYKNQNPGKPYEAVSIVVRSSDCRLIVSNATSSPYQLCDLGKLLTLFRHQLPYLYNGDDDNTPSSENKLNK